MARTAASKKQAAGSVLSLKITLRNTKPPIWRRVLMPGKMTLDDLHSVIQAAMGWEDSHLHKFEIGDKRYGDPSNTDRVINARRMTLDALVNPGVTRFSYTYDFGDDWEHTIVIEKAPSVSDAANYPACIAGKRACPPEDCGGTWGYEDLLAVLANPADPQHEEQREWIGDDFNPEAFSVTKANAALAAVFKRKKLPA